jgi:glycosyltransferase involved in cell wall biosynthesis
MLVVHVAPTTFGEQGLLGGGERYPIELGRALARTGEVDCELVTFAPTAGRRIEESGVRVTVLRPLLHVRRHPAHPVAAGLARTLAAADLVHTHQLRSAPSRMAAVAARARGQTLVTTDHGLGGGGWFGGLPLLFDRFLTVSRYSAQTLRVDPDRTRTIYGGADPDRFFPGPDDERAGVLFVGRITPHKGLDVLIRALPGAAHLTVVGTTGHDRHPPESTYPQLVRRLAAAHEVSFVTAAPDDALPGLYRRAAVAVLPSVERSCFGRTVAISELLGLSVLEAMASGTPVVASRVGGLPEVVTDGETGLLSEPGDVAGLHDRLATVLGDSRLARRLGENARAAVLERFTWDHCARRCLTAYREVLSSSVPRNRRRRPVTPTPAP